MFSFTVNGKPAQIETTGETPLLWVLRDILNLTGTKYGCGIGACGVCIVHVDGKAEYSCLVTLSAVSGRNVRTIEGLSSKGGSRLRCNARGSRSKCRNAAIASQAKS